jgi:uncharacterized protein YdgA (DUF945 family)
MKKFILVLLLVVIAGVAGVSLWGSLHAKQAYRSLILSISESPDMQVIETSYQQGWLQSKAQIDVEIRGRVGALFQQWMAGLGRDEVRGRVGFRMHQTIEHGYLPLMAWLTGELEGTPTVGRVETRLELDKETQSEIASVIGRLPPASISTVIRASGIAESALSIPAQSLEPQVAGDQEALWAARWEGLHGTAVYTTDFDHFAASFHSAGLEGGSAGYNFALRNLQWTADMVRDESGLMVGDVNALVGSFRVAPREEGAKGFEAEGWEVIQSNAVQAGSFGTALEVNVRAIRFGEHGFGPGAVDLRLRNLDAHSLARLQGRSVGGFPSPSSQEVTPATADEGEMSLLSGLASRSPQLEIRTLRLATPSGDVEAKLRIDLDGSQPGLLENLFTLLLVVQVEAEFECPAEIVDSLYQEREEELLALRREGWILLDGERYRSHLKLDGGELLVNGIPKALGGLPGQPEAPTELPQVSAVDQLGPEGVAPGAELLP